MIWSIEVSNEAKRSLLEIERYIADVLLEPATAEKQLYRIRDAIWKLDQLPLRHRLYEHEPWHSLGFRVFPIDNFLIFYLPDEATATVTISHIIHGSRDILAQLEQSE
jgi:toxin ParE1/3/4